MNPKFVAIGATVIVLVAAIVVVTQVWDGSRVDLTDEGTGEKSSKWGKVCSGTVTIEEIAPFGSKTHHSDEYVIIQSNYPRVGSYTNEKEKFISYQIDVSGWVLMGCRTEFGGCEKTYFTVPDNTPPLRGGDQLLVRRVKDSSK